MYWKHTRESDRLARSIYGLNISDWAAANLRQREELRKERKKLESFFPLIRNKSSYSRGEQSFWGNNSHHVCADMLLGGNYYVRVIVYIYWPVVQNRNEVRSSKKTDLLHQNHSFEITVASCWAGVRNWTRKKITSLGKEWNKKRVDWRIMLQRQWEGLKCTQHLLGVESNK